MEHATNVQIEHKIECGLNGIAMAIWTRGPSEGRSARVMMVCIGFCWPRVLSIPLLSSGIAYPLRVGEHVGCHRINERASVDTTIQHRRPSERPVCCTHALMSLLACWLLAGVLQWRQRGGAWALFISAGPSNRSLRSGRLDRGGRNVEKQWCMR